MYKGNFGYTFLVFMFYQIAFDGNICTTDFNNMKAGSERKCKGQFDFFFFFMLGVSLFPVTRLRWGKKLLLCTGAWVV